MILFITILTAITCSLIGNFLVLRRLALLGDAMSHAVLPGIVIAFFAAGQTLTSPLFFVFAVLFCVIMAILIEFIKHHNQLIKEQTAIGIIFTFLFAIGVILLVQFAENVHLDQDAVLYGQIELSSFNHFYLFDRDLGPKALWTLGFATLTNLLVILIFYKELKITTFDQAFSKSIAISPRLIHYIIVTLISITIIAAFDSVGAIIVLALLIVPPATASIISKTLPQMIVSSLIIGASAAILGYFLAQIIDASIAGSVALVSGIILFLTVLMQIFLKKFRSQKKCYRPSE